MRADRSRYIRSLGEAIRRSRLRRQLSQEGLAERCDLHRTYVGGVERGERNVTVATLLRIAHGLGTSPACLLQDAESLLRQREGE